VRAAEIAGAHGVGGNVRLRVIGSPDVALDALRRARKIACRGTADEPDRLLTLGSVRRNSNAKGAWIGRFKELKDRPAVEKLYGYGLFVREGERPRLEDGVYYVDELMGSEVITDAGRKLGSLTEVLNTPANDVYVTDLGAMIPAVAAFVVNVDKSARCITVKDVPGLLGEE
jgi:16S rRNA processing protein RimM